MISNHTTLPEKDNTDATPTAMDTQNEKGKYPLNQLLAISSEIGYELEDLQFAKYMDRKDFIGHLRNEFYYPKMKNLDSGKFIFTSEGCQISPVISCLICLKYIPRTAAFLVLLRHCPLLNTLHSVDNTLKVACNLREIYTWSEGDNSVKIVCPLLERSLLYRASELFPKRVDPFQKEVCLQAQTLSLLAQMVGNLLGLHSSLTKANNTKASELQTKEK